jgi:hypothetical protein
VPRHGVVVEGIKGGKLATMLAEMHKNSAQNGRFPTLFGLNILKTPFFAQKYLIRYTPKTFFEEKINFKNFHF